MHTGDEGPGCKVYRRNGAGALCPWGCVKPHTSPLQRLRIVCVPVAQHRNSFRVPAPIVWPFQRGRAQRAHGFKHTSPVATQSGLCCGGGFCLSKRLAVDEHRCKSSGSAPLSASTGATAGPGGDVVNDRTCSARRLAPAWQPSEVP